MITLIKNIIQFIFSTDSVHAPCDLCTARYCHPNEYEDDCLCYHCNNGDKFEYDESIDKDDNE
ncbi:MAG: hypothetical protein IKR19_07825 [Acholeplasmatales bacterium]|nr:hypothetical protein [Acholeplasmatales bacterium]